MMCNKYRYVEKISYYF